MGSPYRIKDEVSRRERACAELVYVASDQERHIGPARVALQIGIAGTVGGAVAAASGLPEVGAGIILASAALGFWRWRRAPDVAGVLFRVEDGVLVVSVRGTNKVLARTRLQDLRNVSLDTKSIRKVEPGRDVVPAVQFINNQVGPEIDVARILLEIRGNGPATQSEAERRTLEGESHPRMSTIRLTEAFLAHTDSVEWVSKIRVFLRSHGWLPEDERARLSVPDDDSADAEDDALDAEGAGSQTGAPRP